LLKYHFYILPLHTESAGTYFVAWVFNQPVYGFASGDPLRFKRAVGHKDLFYLDDREVDFKEVGVVPMTIH
jgi:hypothetical protein